MYSISPLDNRYYNKISDLSNYFSYNSWIKYRVYVELEYFSFLYKILPELNNIENAKMMEFSDIKNNINIATILELEKRIHHDIKAIEVYLREQYEQLNIGPTKYKEFIHFGLTSQDINSIAFSLQLKDCINECIIPKIKLIIQQLKSKSELWKDTVILALTHGQPAIPTTLGKEIMVFVERIEYCLDKLKNFKYYTKIGGAVGTLAAHYTTYPEIEWKEELTKFCKQLGLERWNTTTQITNYEDIIELSQILIRINSIFIDFSQDIWLYISNEIFVLNKISSEQVGSSTMPQKVNPINFENAEGNLGISNALFVHMSLKCPVSRLQRDLTDSTVLRNLGPAFGHSVIAIKNIIIGLEKLEPNYQEIRKDLKNNEVVLAEAYQTIMRKHGVQDAYKKFKDFTRNHSQIQLKDLHEFIASLDINDNIKKEMYKVVIENYTGYL